VEIVKSRTVPKSAAVGLGIFWIWKDQNICLFLEEKCVLIFSCELCGSPHFLAARSLALLEIELFEQFLKQPLNNPTTILYL
jgi:hypothetical protein